MATATASPSALSTGYGLPRSPSARKIIPLVPRILAEGWTYRKIASETGIAESTARGYLQRIQAHLSESSEQSTSQMQESGLVVARRVQAAKIARLDRIEAQLERLLKKVESGEIDADLLERLVRTDERHNNLARSLGGIDFAEKAALGKIKSEALGKGIGAGMVDALALDLDPDSLFIEAEGVEIAVE